MSFTSFCKHSPAFSPKLFTNAQRSKPVSYSSRNIFSSFLSGRMKGPFLTRFSLPISASFFSTDALRVDPYHSRYRQTVVFGTHAKDDTYLQKDTEKWKEIVELRELTEKSITDSNVNDFIDKCLKAIDMMVTFPKSHIFHWPVEFGFFEEPSPSSKALISGLRRIFDKITGQPHNGSGIALEGARGVGKSHILRVIVQICGLLLPNRVVSVYVDYKSEELWNPSQLLCEAIRKSPVIPENSAQKDNNTDSELSTNEEEYLSNTLNDAFGHASKINKILLFAGDEIGHVYLNNRIWRELHGLVSDTESVTLVANSGSKLRAMIQRSDSDILYRHLKTLKNRELPQSLNDDKLKITTVRPFENMDQYKKLLKGFLSRNNLSKPEKSSAFEALIHSMHMYTGGRLRAISRSSFSLADAEMALPKADSAAFHVLTMMAEQQGHKKFNAFDPVAVNPTIIDKWLREYHNNRHQSDNMADFVDLSTLLDTNIIIEHPIERGKYTFATPADYLRIRMIRPSVFISHACVDKDNLLLKQFVEALRSNYADVKICEDDDAQIAMATNSIPLWETLQTDKDTYNSCVVVVLSENYISRLNETKYRTGVQREANNLSENKGKGPKVVFASLGKLNINWLNHKLLESIGAVDKLVYQFGVTNDDMRLALLHACDIRDKQPLSATPSTPSSAP